MYMMVLLTFSNRGTRKACVGWPLLRDLIPLTPTPTMPRRESNSLRTWPLLRFSSEAPYSANRKMCESRLTKCESSTELVRSQLGLAEVDVLTKS